MMQFNENRANKFRSSEQALATIMVSKERRDFQDEAGIEGLQVHELVQIPAFRCGF